MTIYATPTTQQAPPYVGPPATPPPYLGGPAVMPRRPRRRSGIVTAATAFVIAAVAATVSAITLAQPATPAQHTLNVTPPPPITYGSAEIQAATDTACSAWDRAARSFASAGKVRASLADSLGAGSPEVQGARANEKRVAVSQIAYLRTQLDPATPPEVRQPITAWADAQIDSLHGVNVRDWDASNAARDRGNGLVDALDGECGFG